MLAVNFLFKKKSLNSIKLNSPFFKPISISLPIKVLHLKYLPYRFIAKPIQPTLFVIVVADANKQLFLSFSNTSKLSVFLCFINLFFTSLVILGCSFIKYL